MATSALEKSLVLATTLILSFWTVPFLRADTSFYREVFQEIDSDSSHFQIMFEDGSVMAARSFALLEGSNRLLSLNPALSTGIEKIILDPDAAPALAAIIMPTQSKENHRTQKYFSDLFMKYFSASPSYDQMVVRRDKGHLDVLNMIVQNANQGEIIFRLKDSNQNMRVEGQKLAKAKALLFSGEMQDPHLPCQLDLKGGYLSASAIREESSERLVVSKPGWADFAVNREQVVDHRCLNPGEVFLLRQPFQVQSIRYQGKEVDPSSLIYTACLPVKNGKKQLQIFPETKLLFDLGKGFRNLKTVIRAQIVSGPKNRIQVIIKDADASEALLFQQSLGVDESLAVDLPMATSRLQIEVYGDTADSALLVRPVVGGL